MSVTPGSSNSRAKPSSELCAPTDSLLTLPDNDGDDIYIMDSVAETTCKEAVKL